MEYLGWIGVLTLFVSAQGFLQAAGGRTPPFRDDDGSPVLPNGTQAIITSYKFGCCGYITAWLTYVQSDGMFKGYYDITFQVWRPFTTVQETGCYSMVGQNRFTSISLGRGGLVSETPEPSNILTVQPGDVVGYYSFSTASLATSGIQLDDSQSIDSVWYNTNTTGNLIGIRPDCSFPVGSSDRSLKSSTNAAPVLAVGFTPTTCPPTLNTSPSSTFSLLPSTTVISGSPATPIIHNTNTPILANTGSQSLLLYSSLPPSTTAISASTTIPNTEGSVALSTAVIASVAAVGASALLLSLLCTLVLAITLAKAQHRKQITLGKNHQANTISIRMQGNEAYVTNFHNTDECYASTVHTESNLAYGTVNTGCENQNNVYEDVLPVEPLYST